MRFLSPTPIALLLCSSMTVMAGAIIAPSLPEMQAALARSPRDALLVRLVLTLPSLFTALTSPLAGWMVDRWGRRVVLLGGICLYLVSGSSGLIVATLPQLLVGRALLGVSMACITTASITLIADLFADHDRERFLGLQSGFMGLSAMLFLSLGGLLAEHHWRAPFAIYSLGIFVAWFAARHVPAHHTALTATATSAAATTPPLPVLRITVIYACGFLGMLLFYLIPVQLPFYLQAITHGAASRAGIAIGCATVVGAMTSLQYRRVREILGFRSIFAVMFALVGVSFVLLARATDYRTILLTLALGGLGWGLLVPNATVWLSAIAPVVRRGRLVGGLMTFLFVGQFLSPVAAQPILSRVGLGGTMGTYAWAGYVALGIAVAFFVGGPIWKRLQPM
jgi:MFS family permease